MDGYAIASWRLQRLERLALVGRSAPVPPSSAIELQSGDESADPRSAIVLRPASDPHPHRRPASAGGPAGVAQELWSGLAVRASGEGKRREADLEGELGATLDPAAAMRGRGGEELLARWFTAWAG